MSSKSLCRTRTKVDLASSCLSELARHHPGPQHPLRSSTSCIGAFNRKIEAPFEPEAPGKFEFSKLENGALVEGL